GFVNKIQVVRLSVAKIHRHVFENPGYRGTMSSRQHTTARGPGPVQEYAGKTAHRKSRERQLQAFSLF
ncbi:hypothetical protein, partial [Otoolea muris]|uniref:hypothetical protein n=1 Tax=Otoolea muris TaxID=2941515 RepID=UPI002040D3D0